MKRDRIVFQLVIILIFSAGSLRTNAEGFSKSIQKKIDKAVEASFPHQDLLLDDLKTVKLDFFKYQGIRDVRLSLIKKHEDVEGYACFASSKGKNDFFDYMVLFNKKLEIQKVVVLTYRSSYGGEIMSKNWLKQFIGKGRGEEMEFGKDIDGISGATISAPAITKGVKSMSLLLSELKAKGSL